MRGLLWFLAVVAAVAGVGYMSRGVIRGAFKSPSALAISQAGVDQVKAHEGWSATIYQDVAGLATIGYGHLIKKGEVFNTITKEQGEKLLRADLAVAEAAVRRYVLVPITQGMYDALVSWVFNLGGGALAGSTLLKKINATDYTGAAAEFLKWNKAKVGGELKPVAGLTKRREAEKSLFERGTA